jgi:hypothetical protein
MMKKDNTMVNLDVKGNLAKLIATENIIIQHNKVETASFDVKNRVLTLPIFKEQKGDVYDMLIAHECAHALFTPYKAWEEIATDQELRAYVNVLEDTRIDKLIQKKYPGVVRNYENGYDILDKKNFFGLLGKDINKDLMLIDKVNMRSKSLNRLPFIFAPEDNKWLAKVDSIVTFDDVVALAKEMLNWQKKQVEQMKKLPDFDQHVIAKNYDLTDDEEDSDDVGNAYSEAEESDDQADEKNDFNNFGDQKADSEKTAEQDGDTQQGEKSDKQDGKEKQEATHYGSGSGGDVGKKLLKAVTQEAFDNKHKELLDEKTKGFVYGSIPKPNFKDGLTTYKDFLKAFEKHKVEYRTYCNVQRYDSWLKDKYNQFIKDNKKTVSYLVKEFEMKKAATAYKRASTDKTGVIDPLKLKDYKFSDDIFKRLTIIPDGKNHGMMMLLDWSGSMSDCLNQTIHQLVNLVEFVRRVNIPFEVYFFTSERKYASDESGYDKSFTYKNGDWYFENFNLVNCASHKMTKRQLDQAMMYMFHMGEYYNYRYTSYRNYDYDKPSCYGMPNEFNLGNTPLNEALIYVEQLLPQFKKKYGIEKATLITLTDGGANGMRGKVVGSDRDSDWSAKRVYIMPNGKKMVGSYSRELTDTLLEYIGKEHDTNVIGFYILKRVRKWDLERYCDGDYVAREKQYLKMRKDMTKEKAVVVDKPGYNKYFLLNGKTMKVENFSLQEAKVKKGTTGELKRIFAGSMKNRITSRVVLNKFIQEVA